MDAKKPFFALGVAILLLGVFPLALIFPLVMLSKVVIPALATFLARKRLRDLINEGKAGGAAGGSGGAAGGAKRISFGGVAGGGGRLTVSLASIPPPSDVGKED